jgi:hypothetical protein
MTGFPPSSPSLDGSRRDGDQLSFAAMTSPARFSSAVSPKATLFGVSRGIGVDGRARKKAQHDADDGDARGRCHLLGGVVLVLLALLHLEHRGKP